MGLRLIRDRFIAGLSSCELRRYMDSVPPETPIRDVVDLCGVWKSHADPEIRWVRKPGPEPIHPAYVVGDLDKAPVPEVPMVEKLLQRLVAETHIRQPAPCGGARACGFGDSAQIVTLGAARIGAAASAGILPAGLEMK